MEYKDARRYCVDLLVNRKNIQAAVDRYRKRQIKLRNEMLRKVYYDFDPKGDKLLRMTREEVPEVDVRWRNTQEIFKLERPESWLATFREALGLYKNEFGQMSYTYIVLHYAYGWPIERICRRYKMSRNNYYIIHRQFTFILLLIAVQNGLIIVEKSFIPKGEENFEDKES